MTDILIPFSIMSDDQHAVLQTLITEIEKKNSWGKNELVRLIAQIAAQTIDRGSVK